MTTIKWKLRYWRWQLALQLAAVRHTFIQGFWLSLAPILWQSPALREAYYAYREQSWRNAHTALSFELWLAAGGWKKGGSDGRS